MPDFPYRREEVSEDVRHIFDQLVKEFGDDYQIWRRVEDYGRWLSAGILDPKSQMAVTISLRSAQGIRNGLLSESEIQRIHKYFASDPKEDLDL